MTTLRDELNEFLLKQGVIGVDARKQIIDKMAEQCREYHHKMIGYNKDLPLPFSSEKFKKTWLEWLAYRRERGWSKYKKIGFKRATTKLVKLSGGSENTAIDIIEQSMDQGYMGFFSVKNQINGTEGVDRLRESIINKHSNSGASQ